MRSTHVGRACRPLGRIPADHALEGRFSMQQTRQQGAIGCETDLLIVRDKTRTDLAVCEQSMDKDGTALRAPACATLQWQL